jgi:uncharacterized protein YeaO (DUF488 family)
MGLKTHSALLGRARPSFPVDVATKRIYEPAGKGDGYRVLIDGLWPRGLSRERARIDEWARDLAPSESLRRWYGHQPRRFDGFRRRYVRELAEQRDLVSELRARARKGRVTLVFAARDAEHSNAAVLASVLRRGLPRRPQPRSAARRRR